MNAAVGVPTGSASGSGTVGSKIETASYASAPTAPPVKRGMPSVGWTRRRGTKARSASSGSGASTVVIGSSGSYRSTVTGRSWMLALPSRTSRSRRGPTPRNEYRPRRSPPSTDSRRYAGVVPSSSRRNAPIGVSRSADRVARRSIVSALPASRFAWVRLSGSVMVTCGASGGPESKRPLVSGTKGRAFRGATLIRRCRTFLTDGWSCRPPIGAAR